MTFTAHTKARLARIVDALLSTNWSEGLVGQMAYSAQMPDERAALGELCASALAAQPVERVHAFGRPGGGKPALYAGYGSGSRWDGFTPTSLQGSSVRGHDAALREVSGSQTAIHPHNWPVTDGRAAHPCWACSKH